MKKVILISLASILGLAAIAATIFVVKFGPRNVIGMLRYDQRREGDLKVGDRAPEAQLVSLDGKSSQSLFVADDKPTVVIFGSFT